MSGQRAPSRTPPFVLVGLLVVLGFSGYSYYSLYSSNSNLSTQLEAARLEKRNVDSQYIDVRRSLTSAKLDATALKTEADQLKKEIEVKGKEIQSLKAQIDQKASDEKTQKSLMGKCDEKLAVVQKDLEAANGEKINLQKTLDAEREKAPVCSMESCHSQIQQALSAASKLVGSNKVQQALADAKMDADKLMSGIDFPDPAETKPQAVQPPAVQPQAVQPPNPPQQPAPAQPGNPKVA